jgi:hypothetical protein
MNVDKKTQEVFSKILGEVFGKGDVKIYETVAAQGVTHKEMKKLELESNKEKINNFSPFSAVISSKKSDLNNEDKKLHSEVIQNLKDKKQMLLDEKSFKKIMGSDTVMSKFSNMIADTVSNIVDHPSPEEDIQKMSVIAKRSKDKELAKSYLLMKHPDFQSSNLQVLAKGIKNVENPMVHSDVPKEVIQEAGMIQIGLALNEMATSAPRTRIANLSIEDSIKVKKMTQAVGDNNTEFILSCKKMARHWENKHMGQLVTLVEQQNKKITKEKELKNDNVTEIKMEADIKNMRKRINPQNLIDDPAEGLEEELRDEINNIQMPKRPSNDGGPKLHSGYNEARKYR